MLDFNEWERKYGSPAAEALLRQIEKVARIQSWAMAGLDPQTRLENALRIQDAMERQPFTLMAA